MSSSTLEGEIIETYRPLCVTAMVGLALGLASLTALLHPIAWFVPLLAAFVNVMALRSIARAPNQSGRWAALSGLALSLGIGTFEPARLFYYEAAMQADAKQLADEWFGYLRRGEPEKAFQLAVPLEERRPFDDNLWTEYRKSVHRRSGLVQYVRQPLVRTLLALGDKAQVRYYACEGKQAQYANEFVNDVYAVTFDRDGEKTTFFLQFVAVRQTDPHGEQRVWRIDKTVGDHVPQSYPGEKPPKLF